VTLPALPLVLRDQQHLLGDPMRMFEPIRRVQPKPNYQFHFELSQDEVDKLEMELEKVRLVNGMSTIKNVIFQMLREVPESRR
jgi:hypothetical protein